MYAFSSGINAAAVIKTKNVNVATTVLESEGFEFWDEEKIKDISEQ